MLEVLNASFIRILHVDLTTGESIRMFKCDRPTLVTSHSLDHTGNWLALGDMNGVLSLWNPWFTPG